MASNYAKTSLEGLDWGIVTDGVVGPSGHIGGWVAVLSPPVTYTSRLSFYGGGMHGLPAAMTCDTPAVPTQLAPGPLHWSSHHNNDPSTMTKLSSPEPPVIATPPTPTPPLNLLLW